MKTLFYYLGIFLLLGFWVSCSKDNYDEPKSVLKGRIVYDNTTLQLRGTGEAVTLQLYQHGYDYFNPINIFVSQDGTFSATLFDGDYLLVTKDGNGPWVNNRDSMMIALKGNTEIEFNVTPYFMIENDQISLSGNNLNASFSIKRIVETSNISNVMILLNKTQFVDDINNIYRQEVTDPKIGENSVTVDLSENPDVAKAKALFARICIRAQNADQGLYSPVIRLK